MANLKRTTVSIPTEYYERIIKLMQEEGYVTVNELLLDLIRHHYDAGYVTKVVVPPAIPLDVKSLTPTPPFNPPNVPRIKTKKVDKSGFCPHFLKGYCRRCEE